MAKVKFQRRNGNSQEDFKKLIEKIPEKESIIRPTSKACIEKMLNAGRKYGINTYILIDLTNKK